MHWPLLNSPLGQDRETLREILGFIITGLYGSLHKIRVYSDRVGARDRSSALHVLPQGFVCDEALLASLTRLVGLSALKFSRGSLTTLSGLHVLAGSLSALSALSSLDLSGAPDAGNHTGAFALAPALPPLARSLQRLCLSGNFFRVECVAALAATMTGLTALQALDLGGSLSNGSMPALAQCLFQLTALTLLSLSRNGIAEASVKLQRLGHTRVDEAGLAALVPSLARLTSLRHLDLGDLYLGIEGTSPLLPSLAGALGKLVSLTHLDMGCDNLLDREAAALAGGLSRLTALRHLDFGGVREEGAAALSALLRDHLRSLQFFSLTHCLFYNVDDVFLLAGALQGLVSIRHLTLSHMCDDVDPDGPEAAQALAAALSGLTWLTRLDLSSNNGFGEAGAVALADSLLGLSRLQSLDYSSCCAKERGMAALCRSLRFLPRLQHLNLSHNQSPVRGDSCCNCGVAAALGPSLPSLTALTLRDLSYNDLNVGVAAAMAPGLRQLSQLRVLNLEHNCFMDGGVALLGGSLKVSQCGLTALTPAFL